MPKTKKAQICFSLDEKIDKKLKIIVQKTGLSKSMVVSLYLHGYCIAEKDSKGEYNPILLDD